MSDIINEVISRERVGIILEQHGWGFDTCTVSHTRMYHVGPLAGKMQRGVSCEERGNGLDNICDSFDIAIPVRPTYKLVDVKNWLGY